MQFPYCSVILLAHVCLALMRPLLTRCGQCLSRFRRSMLFQVVSSSTPSFAFCSVFDSRHIDLRSASEYVMCSFSITRSMLLLPLLTRAS